MRKNILNMGVIMGNLNVVDLMTRALLTVLIAAAPPLICGLAVGILASIFQTVTSIQEPTLAFVPKIVAVMVALIIFGAFIGAVVQTFTIEVINSIPGIMNG
jgi:flagellar biosynthetic protein FliQ